MNALNPFSDTDINVIAEVGLAHEGSLGQAHSYIDLAAQCGATAVKFQTHIPEEESTPEEKFRVKVFPQDETRFDYWKRTSFEKQQWLELADHARQQGLLFLSSPFSELAVDWLIDCDVAAWKVASGEVNNLPMLRRMCETQKPILLSSGMSSWLELDESVQFIKNYQSPLVVFQCTTSYPCPPESWGLNVLAEMKDRYQVEVGLSDHSGTIFPSLAAVSLGATFLEVHIAFSKLQFGPDTKASLSPDEFSQMVDGVGQINRSKASPVDKDVQAEQFGDLHRMFSKSIVSRRDLQAGHFLAESDLTLKKPGTGFAAKLMPSLVGRELRFSVSTDHIFKEEDFA